LLYQLSYVGQSSIEFTALAVSGKAGQPCFAVDQIHSAEMEMATRQKAATSPGRIVPTEARPSELSGCIVGAGNGGVKANSSRK
jgi:hypothetical protein